MFCPTCRDEFRPGFTRCARCEVDLVQELKAAQEIDVPPEIPVRLADFCGFFTIDDAREARGRLREQRIACEIAIRESSGAEPGGPLTEEFWLRVDAGRYREARALLGDSAEAVSEEIDGS